MQTFHTMTNIVGHIGMCSCVPVHAQRAKQEKEREEVKGEGSGEDGGVDLQRVVEDDADDDDGFCALPASAALRMAWRKRMSG